MQLGDKVLILKNPEDMSTAYSLEVTDVFEVGHNETYFEITERKVTCQKNSKDQSQLRPNTN